MQVDVFSRGLFLVLIKHLYMMLPVNNKIGLSQMGQFFRVVRTKLRLGAAAFF